MFQLDDQFLADVGLATLPDEQKKPFLQHTYDQLEEFESIIDRKEEVIVDWLSNHAPNYQSEEVFVRLMQASNLQANDPGLRAEYAATKWLEVNRPDYRDVVAQTLAQIKQEILSNKDAILGATALPPQAA